MEELARIQAQNGEVIKKIISNFKKDSEDRKTTKAYFQERLRRLEEAWSRFEFTDNQIRAISSPPLVHPYFVKDYYNEITNACQEYKEIFLENIKTFEDAQDPIDDDAAQQPSDKASPEKLTVPPPIQERFSGCKKGASPEKPTVPSPLQEKFSEGKRIMRRQRGVIDSLRRLLDGISTHGVQNYSQHFYDIKIQSIRLLWSQIEDLNYSIWEICDDPAMEGYNIAEYVQLEEEVQQSLIQLSTKRSSETTFPVQHSINSTLKLPKITLPKFDGDYTKWRQFADLFTQMVHKQDMADCQKMWYLKANVTGEAEKLIRHLALSNENYKSAWKMLKDRYENKRLLVASLINKLLAQPTQTSDASAATIRTFHDTTQECLLGLENMGIPTDNWDPLLIHILIKKMDKTTHTLYEQTLENPKELQTIKYLLTFLQNRFQSLEALGTKSRNTDEHLKRHHAVRTLTSIATPSSCISCKENHPIFACKNFLKLSPTNRLKLLRRHNLCVNCLRSGHNATNCTLRGCTKCSKKHNTLVHLDGVERVEKTPPAPLRNISVQKQPFEHTSNHNLPGDQSLTLATLSSQEHRSYVLLSTAWVRLVATNGREIECRAILDSGSQINIVTERIIKRIGVTSTPDTMLIQGIGNGREQTQKRVSLQLQSLVSGFSQRLEAYVLPNIIPPQPTERLDTSTWSIPNNIKLADPKFNHPSNIDLLLGAEFYHQLLTVGQIKLNNSLPILQNTLLGWIVAGKISKIPLQTAICGICSDDENLNKTIEKFWRLEEIDTSSPKYTSAERKCETHFNQTTRRNFDGRFIVSLPFSDDPRRLGESKDIALRRFVSLEKRLAKDTDLKSQYVEFMKEYLALGHMQEINTNELGSPHYFLPHHSVLKPDSSTTKLRVVFDASCKTSSNLSLNDILYAGPTVQDDLFSILLRFRSPRYVFTADIQKMYRRVLLQPDDRKFHLIFWGDDFYNIYQQKTKKYSWSFQRKLKKK